MTEKESFETALKSLEDAVEKLEKGEIPLEDSLALFEEGVRCAAVCREKLKSVEEKVSLLVRDREGNLSLEEQSRD